ncbi:MAG: SMC-Scp complex subunit ScpB [Patescibacteria group bacterium]
MNLEAQIEAILFWKAEPVSVKTLAQILGKNEVEIGEALNNLETALVGRGLRLVRKDDEVMLGTAPEVGELIEKLTREELSRDIGKAGLETLAVIIYQGPVSRAQIDYVRGVNSSFIVRHLLVRGLVEKVPNPEDARSFLYRPTFDLLSHLGISKLEEAPDYEVVKQKLNEFISHPNKN